MSINWVMLDGQDFVRLPGEKPIFKSPPRIALSLSTPKSYPAASGSVSIASDSGMLYITNQRTPAFQSFSAPLLKLHDSHLTMPWFGPNYWMALVEPVAGGNLPAVSTGIELKLTFKEGGAPDFSSSFERIKERLQQAVEAARDSGSQITRQGASLSGVNMDAVHLDQLPSYEDSGHDRIAPPEMNRDINVGLEPPAAATSTISTPQATSTQQRQQPPSDAPPGYEETQWQNVQHAP